jgi:hypothetical protein
MSVKNIINAKLSDEKVSDCFVNKFKLCSFNFVHDAASEDVFVGVWLSRVHYLKSFYDFFTFILLFAAENFFEGVLLMKLKET